jgi:hypothetical protein
VGRGELAVVLLENPEPNFVDTSINHLTLDVSMLGIRLSLPQKTILLAVGVTFRETVVR